MLSFKTMSMIATGVIILSLAGFIYHKGGSNMASKINTESIKTDIAIQEKKDEIRNNRPSVNALIISLRTGKF